MGEHWKDSPSSVLDIYHELIAAGLRIWVFRSFFFLYISFLQLLWRFGGLKKSFVSVVTVEMQMLLYQSHQPGTA